MNTFDISNKKNIFFVMSESLCTRQKDFYLAV